jgi:hypothetical protein
MHIADTTHQLQTAPSSATSTQVSPSAPQTQSDTVVSRTSHTGPSAREP